MRTFSGDELKGLFRVNPSTRCDTHSAIKCGCEGSAREAEEKTQALQEQGPGAGEAEGVNAWAHLTLACDSPDPMWQVGGWGRISSGFLWVFFRGGSRAQECL